MADRKSAYINVGGGIRFLSADYFVRELEPLGMTMRGFRALCRALGVPMIRIGKTWVVELFAFHTAMRAISRVGAPDFLMPGSDLKSSGYAKRMQHCTDKLDENFYRDNFEIIVGELLATRACHGLPSPKVTVKAARDAAKRLVEFGIQDLPDGAARKKARLAFKKNMKDRAPGKVPSVNADQ